MVNLLSFGGLCNMISVRKDIFPDIKVMKGIFVYFNKNIFRY